MAAESPDPDLSGFHCIQCQACCRQTGHVRLLRDEPDRIARYLGMDVLEFIDTYTILARDRQCLSLMDQEDGACIFLTPQGCRIHPVKPVQCRTFPLAWKFSDFKKICGWAKQQDTKAKD